MKRKILITGANGFIGSNLVDFLLREKIPLDSLRLFIEKNTSLENLPEKNFDIIRGDIRNKQDVKKAMEGVETVYHLAALAGFGAKTYQAYKEVNVDGTQNLLDACKKKSLQKFVFFSSIAVFGLPAWIGNIYNWDENHPKTYSEIYGQSKWEAEKRVILAHEKNKTPYTIVRPVSVYGPRDKGQLFGLYKAIKKKYFIMIGDGSNKLDFVFVDDLVKGVRQAQLSKERANDYIFSGNEPISFKNIVSAVARSIHSPPPKFHMPTSIGIGVSYIAEFFGNMLQVQVPLFPSRVRVMTRTYYYSHTKATKELAYKPETSFEKGTMITGKWYLNHNFL